MTGIDTETDSAGLLAAIASRRGHFNQ